MKKDVVFQPNFQPKGKKYYVVKFLASLLAGDANSEELLQGLKRQVKLPGSLKSRRSDVNYLILLVDNFSGATDEERLNKIANEIVTKRNELFQLLAHLGFSMPQ